jgi:hypothetical protein
MLMAHSQNGKPFSHDLAILSGIKGLPVSRGDERIHPRLGKFDNESAPDKQGKDFLPKFQSRRAEPLPIGWEGFSLSETL